MCLSSRNHFSGREGRFRWVNFVSDWEKGKYRFDLAVIEKGPFSFAAESGRERGVAGAAS